MRSLALALAGLVASACADGPLAEAGCGKGYVPGPLGGECRVDAAHPPCECAIPGEVVCCGGSDCYPGQRCVEGVLTCPPGETLFMRQSACGMDAG